ncbi:MULTISPECIES: DEAD/DEAH box helicase [Streptomyces]|uniref:DEAD/DEAH box helicase n=4 Tax=Streptomyces TaxID=1883 RepID=A0ABD5EB94_9ACTN|nr:MULTISPECIES: DEAD/DEAH box helicase [unclassified Streptomyces]ASY33707.1 RNA helicase [Streptomyces sp. CLI2509]MDT0418638.1 DEAD/DEAH box helicase [Streptomyces sp. DSM 41982]
MSVSTSDHSVVPASDQAPADTTPELSAPAQPTAETVDAVDAVEAEAAESAPADEAPAEKVPGFAELGLPENIVRKLTQNGVTSPFPIQAATIPDALAGKDILGRGRTGSGKTLSFGLPLLASLAGGFTDKKKPRGIILTPTRELAMQVADALQPYGDVLDLRMKVVCGGTSMSNQIYALERGVDILVATPGRLRDLINRGACSLEKVRIAILDEADQMADLGFMPEVTELLDQVPAGGQRMLFSATLENEIDALVKRYLVDPVAHEVDAAQGAVTTMSHHILIVKPRDKAPVTAAIASRKGRTIIFVRTQLGADRVAEQLRDAGVKADALHGGMTQGARTRVLADFKDGYVNVLVATDVAARGIHVDGIDLVLNVDPAGDHKDYLHRSGRTARAGRSGTVVSLSLPHQRRQIFRLMEDAGVDAARHQIGSAVFDAELAEITGARSMTEVQAESAGQSAKQAEREVEDLTRELERAKRRASEYRAEADRLVARAARERGEEPPAPAAVAEGTEPVAEQAVAAAEPAPVAAAEPAPVAERRSYDRDRDERPSYRGNDRRDDRRDRDDRPSFRRDNDRRDDRRDDRGGRGFDRDRGGERGGFGGRGGEREHRSYDRRDDRGGRGFERRDDRGGRGFDRDRRDDRRDGDRPAFRRDDRPGFRRDNDRRDDRGGRGFERRDDRGGRGFDRDRGGQRDAGRPQHRGAGDRPYNRDHRGTGDRPYGRRDDRGAGSSFAPRRDDKPRWKRNG